MGPIGEHSYSDLALAILDADRVYFQSKNKDVLINEFSERKVRKQAGGTKALRDKARSAITCSSGQYIFT